MFSKKMFTCSAMIGKFIYLMNKTEYKIALVRKQLSQVALASKLRVDPAHLSRVVCGWIKPSEELKDKISKMLDADETTLFGEAD